MAGAIAQQEISSPPTIASTMKIWQNEAQDDYSKFREFCQILRNIRYGEASREDAKTQLNEISAALFQAAVRDVQECIIPIRDISKQVSERVAEVNKEYIFTAEEILALPSVQSLLAQPPP